MMNEDDDSTCSTPVILLPDREAVSEEEAREQVAADLKATVPGITRDRLTGTVTLVNTILPGRVISLLQQHPKLASEKFQKPQSTRSCIFFSDRTHEEDGFLPLVYLILLSEYGNIELLRVVIDLYPQALLATREKTKNTILHDVCGHHCRQRNPDELIPLLVQSCPEAASTPNAKGFIPLQICHSFASLPAIRALVDAYPQGLCRIDPNTGYGCFARALTARNGRQSVDYMIDKLEQESMMLESLLVAKERKWPTCPIHVPHFQRLLARTRRLVLRHVDLAGEIPPLTTTIAAAAASQLQVLELCDVQLKNGATVEDLMALVTQLSHNLQELSLSLADPQDVTLLVASMLRGNTVEKLELRGGVRIEPEGVCQELRANKSLKQLYSEDSLRLSSSRKLLADVLEQDNDVLQDVALPPIHTSCCSHSKNIIAWTRLNWCGRRSLRVQDDILLPRFVEIVSTWEDSMLNAWQLTPTATRAREQQRLLGKLCWYKTQSSVNSCLSIPLDEATTLNAWFCFLRESANLWSNAYSG